MRLQAPVGSGFPQRPLTALQHSWWPGWLPRQLQDVRMLDTMQPLLRQACSLEGLVVATFVVAALSREAHKLGKPSGGGAHCAQH